jgi:ribosome-associated protein
VRSRLEEIAGKRLSKEGWLVIDARQYRTQERNRQDALDRFTDLLRRAAQEPKRRRKTRPTREARRRRLENKRKRSQLKRLRKTPLSDN